MALRDVPIKPAACDAESPGVTAGEAPGHRTSGLFGLEPLQLGLVAGLAYGRAGGYGLRMTGYERTARGGQFSAAMDLPLLRTVCPS